VFPGDDGGGLAAGYIAGWRPSSVSPQAAAFARDVISRTGPQGRERVKNLLQSAAKLADYAVPLGLDPIPEVLLHPSVIERFARCAPGLSGVARRTLRTHLRFIARRVVPELAPADVPLPRERAKQPYSPAEIAGYLALADAQPAASRRMRAAGLVCLGAGAGLIRGDLRAVRGSDVICRSGGVIVAVRGTRPRAVPVLSRYHGRLLAAARFAGTAPVCGGADPGRRNITTSDIYLGWTKGLDVRRNYYWRQLRDMKGSVNIEALVPFGLTSYAQICGWTLAHAHARSGDPVAIAAYLGETNAFDTSLTGFAERYADQNESDYTEFVNAIKSGRLKAEQGV
jgi:integrase